MNISNSSGYILLVISITLVSLALSLNPDIFLYQRSALSQAEVWRLITGHLSHFSLQHGLFNIVALIGLIIINEGLVSLRWMVFYIAIFCILLSVSFYVFLPDLFIYAGLSGVLHALFVTILIYHLLYRSKAIGVIMLLIIIAKLIYENVFDRAITDFAMADIQILKEAHWYGVWWSVVVTPIVILTMRLIRNLNK